MAKVPRLLEDPSTWRKIHNLWISEIYHALKPQVAGRLSLSIGEEVTLIELDQAARRLYPDVHLSELSPGPAQPAPKRASGSTAYAEGLEELSTERRHYIAIYDLAGSRLIAILEVLSPTNNGYDSRADLDVFADRRQRLLAGDIAYLEVDAVPAGTRWLPRCLKELETYPWIAWTSTQEGTSRRFRGWAWGDAGPLPRVPWDLGRHGTVEVDLDLTFREALQAGGIESSP